MYPRNYKEFALTHMAANNDQLLIKYNQRDVHLKDKFGNTSLILTRKFGYSCTARVLSSWKLKHRRLEKLKMDKDNYKMLILAHKKSVINRFENPIEYLIPSFCIDQNSEINKYKNSRKIEIYI